MKDDLSQIKNAGNDSELLRAMALGYFKEKRAARRWSIFFRIMGLVMVGLVFWLVRMPAKIESTYGPHTAMVELNGVIAEGTDASADSINELLREAFADNQSKGVILKINSPGGTPVQAARINAEMARLRAEYPQKPLYAVVSDVCASGGYYVAVAAQAVYVAEASMVGSIGVRLDSFGLEKVMDKLGVERRTITAGEHKALLDPFAPQSEFERAHLQSMLNDVHQQFIKAVRDGRGDRLKEDDNTFSGLVWSGTQAQKFGLVDALGDEDKVARDVIGAKEIIIYSPDKTLFQELTQGVSTAMIHALQNAAPLLRM